MKLLAVDTALGACSVAICEDEKLLAHMLVVMERGHAEALAPMVEATMKDAACAFSDLDRLAVTTGPGTFSGQRVGLAFMRGLRIALEIPLLGVTTLSAMAHQAMAQTGQPTGVALHDARRGEVYLEFCGVSMLSPCILPFEAAVVKISQLTGAFVLAGTAAARAHEQLPNAALSNVLQPDALWVAQLARSLPPQDAAPKPLYLRPPDAKLPAQT